MNQSLQAFVTRDTLIGDMVKKYPAISEVVAKYGIHCVGCHVSKFEAFGQGLAAHGYSSEKIDAIVDEVNMFIASRNLAKTELISVSEFAAKKIKQYAEKQGLTNFYLRASVKKGGCAGNTSTLDFTTEKKDDDMIIQAHDVKLLVDPASKPFLDGAILEFVESLNETGFKLHNPNAKKSCACGTSFTV